MVSWLTKTAQLLRPRQAAEPPAPFDVGCACGHHVAGMRQALFQAVLCQRCGNPVFILPLDVYPKPKTKKSPAKKASTPTAHPVPRVEAVQPVPVPSTQATGAQRTQGTGSVPRRAGRSDPAIQEESKPGAPVAVVSRRPLLSRFGLILLAMGGVVVATGYFVWQSRLKDRALVSLPVHLEAGEAALRAGNVPLAADEYRQAAAAVDRLGRSDAESAGIRQKAKELNAVVKLSAISLYDICEDARRSLPAGSQKWSEKFHELYRDSWIVVEGDIIEDSGPDGTGQAIVRFPFPIDGAPVVIDARLKALAAPSVKGVNRHVIFAGQLASLSKEGAKSPLWVIRLKDASAFLWADFDTYQALGLALDVPGDENDARRILTQQAATLGVKP